MDAWEQAPGAPNGVTVGDIERDHAEQVARAREVLATCDSFLLVAEDTSLPAGGMRVVSSIIARKSSPQQLSRHGHRFLMRTGEAVRAMLDDFAGHVK